MDDTREGSAKALERRAELTDLQISASVERARATEATLVKVRREQPGPLQAVPWSELLSKIQAHLFRLHDLHLKRPCNV